MNTSKNIQKIKKRNSNDGYTWSGLDLNVKGTEGYTDITKYSTRFQHQKKKKKYWSVSTVILL